MSDNVTQLCEIADVQTGPFGSQLHAGDYVPNGTPIVTVEHLVGNRIGHDGVPMVGEADVLRLSRYLLEEGDLVFSRVGAIDRCALVLREESQWLFSGRLLRVRPNPSRVDPRFLAHVLVYEPSQRWIRNHAVGSTMPCLNTAILGRTPLFIPPLREQRRIADVLDAVDGAIRSTELLLSKLDRMDYGLLHDLIAGGVDSQGHGRDPIHQPEMFIDTKLGRLPRHWEIRPIADLMKSGRPVTYGIVQPGDFRADGVPLIRGQDYINGWRALPTFFRVAPHLHRQFARSATRAGDVLLTIVGATTGATAIVPTWVGDANITQTTARLAFDPSLVVPEFARALLDSELGHVQVRHYLKGSAQPGLNLADVERFLMPVPPIDEQRAITSRLAVASARTRQEASYLDRLRLVRIGLMDDLMSGRRHPLTVNEDGA